MTNQPTFNSPLGRRQLSQKPAQPAVLTVPDASKNVITNSNYDETAPIEDFRNLNTEQINKLRQETQFKQNKINEPTKSVMEILLGLKSKSKDIDIDGVIFTLKSLKNTEVKKVFQDTAKEMAKNPENFTTLALSMMETKIRTVVAALKAIDGKPVSFVLGTDDSEAIKSILENMDDSVIDKLYAAYSEMNQEIVKDAPKTTEEMTENLKK